VGDRDHADTGGVHLEDSSDDSRLIRVDHTLDEGALTNVDVPIALAAGDVALLSASFSASLVRWPARRRSKLAARLLKIV
jgi:hypothetical protein